ncbi:MAG: NAD(P)/FAD-dependent oxidoreductase, partial [Microbacterium gubbeenense]
MNTQPWDVIIIGGGAAGLSAALMLGRSRRRTLVIDTGSPRNRFASHMHGVLGNEGTSPADLVERGRAEAAGYGVEFLADAVERVDQTDDGVLVKLREGDPLHARALIVASGLVDDLPDIPGLAERWGKSVLHCPYCHGWEVRGQRLAILATSPLGLHHAQLVRQWTDDLTVFT